jgi:hypothetical protein
LLYLASPPFLVAVAAGALPTSGDPLVRDAGMARLEGLARMALVLPSEGKLGGFTFLLPLASLAALESKRLVNLEIISTVTEKEDISRY